jgi:O-antigen/teichoic acid export membrane protein
MAAPARQEPAAVPGPGVPDGRPWQRAGTRLRGWLRANHLVRNALYLMLTAGVQAALGLAFWVLAARLFTAPDVGRAGSLISAAVVCAFLALLGLDTTFVRYLPTAADRDALATSGLLLAAGAGAVAGAGYMLLVPRLAPRLAFVGQHPLLALGFVVLTTAGAVNLLTDSVFIAARRAGFNVLADGVIGGSTKLACVAIATGTGSYGLFCASASGFLTAALASLVIIGAVLGYRPALRRPARQVLPLLRFSGASYAGNMGSLLPDLVVPLIVLDRLGAAAAAYYYVAFSVATLLYSAAYAVEQTFLAEGSQAGVGPPAEVARRSWRVLLALCLPACAAFALASHWLLLVFGARYSRHATAVLIVLALAGPPIAANNWLQALLRLQHRLRAAVLSTAVRAVLTCALAWLLAPHGLAALAAAWPVGSLAAAAGTALAYRPLLGGRRPAAASAELLPGASAGAP